MANISSVNGLPSQIIAHRGFWYPDKGLEELKPNSFEAIARASNYGFGLETDIRDRGANIVIEHDAFTDSNLLLEDILPLKFESFVCLNIKSDGLGARLANMKLWDSVIFFDLSIPEMIAFEKLNLPLADRISELENISSSMRSYIWLDSFFDDSWIQSHSLEKILEKGHYVIVVSPELHKRSYLKSWSNLKPLMLNYPNLLICTDLPLSAKEFVGI